MLKQLIALWIISLVCLSPAQAALMLQGELTHEYHTAAGQLLSGILTINNTGSEALALRLYQQDVAPDGSSKPHRHSNRAWIQLNEDNLVLAPRSTRQVSYSVTVPQQVQTGTYWSTLNVEPLKADNASQQMNENGKVTFGVKQKVRYAVNVMTHIGQGAGNIVFQSPHLKNSAKGKLLQFSLINQGNFHSQAQVSLDVFDSRGRKLGQLKGNKRGLYPGAEKQFEIPLTGLKQGQYKTLIVAQDNKSGRTFGADLNLTIQP